MGKYLRKAEAKLARRVGAYQTDAQKSKDGGKAFTKPGSMNPRKMA